MKSRIALASALLAVPAILLSAAPAMANNVQWSVTVGAPQPGYYQPQPVYVETPQAVYAPPPRVVYAPAPPVVYAPPPRAVVVRPQPVYTPGVTVIEYGGRPSYREPHWRHHHWERDREYRQEYREHRRYGY